MELLEVLLKLLRLNYSTIDELIISIGSQLMGPFGLPDLPTVKMLLHYFPVDLGLLIILEQVLLNIHRIRVVVGPNFMLYATWVHQVVHLHEVGLFLDALSICMIPLFVINSVI